MRPYSAFSQEDPDEIIEDHDHEEDVKRGERFFKGLLPKDRKFDACVSCHVLTAHADTMNWNPSAMDIAKKFVGKDFSDFQDMIDLFKQKQVQFMTPQQYYKFLHK